MKNYETYEMIPRGCSFWKCYKLQPYENHLKLWKCYEVFEMDIYIYTKLWKNNFTQLHSTTITP